MTASVHAITGAAIAFAVKRPELAIPLAFLSHFAMDALPHYEPAQVSSGLNSGVQKIKLPYFRVILTSDLLIFVGLLIFLPGLAVNDIKWWSILLCAGAAAAPDFTWGWHLFRAKIGKKVVDPIWLTRFHIRIQLIEKPWGGLIELYWFAAMLLIIIALTK